MKKSGYLIVSLFCFVFVGIAQGQITILSDSFDRPNNTDLSAVDAGMTGSLAPAVWSEKTRKGSPEIVSNQLQLGELSATDGWSIAWVDHNFTDSLISSSNEFTVAVDISDLGSMGGTRFSGFGVGNALADLNSWSMNNPSNFVSDFFIGYDPTGTTEVKIFLGGTQAYQQSINLSSGARLSVRFHGFSDFNAGTIVNYEAFIDEGTAVATGSFAWSGTNENYINLYSNYTNNTGRFDDFEVSTVPEPGIYGLILGSLAAGIAFWRRRK